jgi:hypothetical protein
VRSLLVIVVLTPALGGCTDAPSSSAPVVPHFVEVAASGISHRYTGDFDFFVGGGVATFDCNGDGRPDLYFAGGADPAALYRNESTVGGTLRFVPVPSSVTDLPAVTGAYPIDLDSDGITDLVVLRNGAPSVVLHGLGDCRFEQANDRFGIDGGNAWTTAFSATWEGGNQLPTLAFGSYLNASHDACGDDQLIRPAANGMRYDTPIALAPSFCTLSMLFSDWSRRGEADLRVTNDRHYYTAGEEQLWKVAPGEPPRQYTDADGWRPVQVWGMGIASRDVTGDGYPDVFLTSQGDNKLQSLDAGAAGPSFHDIALRRGVTAQRPAFGGDVLPSTAWHPEFADVNNDGLVDLFVSKGNVDAQTDHASRDPSDLFIQQPDGIFAESAEAAGIVNFDRARGAALVDLNLDGMLDLVVVNRDANVRLWRNVGTGDVTHPRLAGHWIELRVRQPAPNVDAIGAWVEVQVGEHTDTREITIGGGHASGELGWLHFGIGAASSARIRVRWPGGEVGPWIKVAANRFATIERGASSATPWSAPN